MGLACGGASILTWISRFVVEGHACMSRQLHWMQELLRILPDLGGMCAEGEPETNKIRLKIEYLVSKKKEDGLVLTKRRIAAQKYIKVLTVD